MNPNYSLIEGTPPDWMGDYGSRDYILPAPAKVDPSQFLATDGVIVVVSGAAAVDAVSVPVNALAKALANGTLLDFGGKKFARLTAAAAAGATSLTVSALATALAANDTATYRGVGKKSIPSGTAIGRTIAERDAGTNYGPAVDTDDEIYLTTRDIYDADSDNDVELYRHMGTVKENFLPGIGSMTSNLKTKLRSLYHCVKGAN